jgi:hypothetical protein
VKHLLVGGRQRARIAIERAMGEAGLASLDAELGPGGTQALLAGGWLADAQMQAIELALAWPYGTINAIVDRPPYSELSGTEHAMVALMHELSEPERAALIELVKVTKAAQGAARTDQQVIDGELA